MLVGVYYNNNDVRLDEMPKPAIGPDEILMKVIASGICGSDVMEWYKIQTAPRVLGHEATGIIEEIGEKVTKYSVGDRVFVTHHVPCNNCRSCIRGQHTACEMLHTTNYYPGGFSQYIRVPKINVEYGTFKLPPHMSFEEGTFIEPLGCVVRGQRLTGMAQDDCVLIVGSGITGLLHLKMARQKGVERVIVADINPYRMKLAERFDADFAVDSRNLPQKLRESNDGRLADKVIVCSGATQAYSTALECVDKGGTILFFAVPDPTVKTQVPINKFWRDEITLKTSYGAAKNDLDESLRLLAKKKIEVKDMITHRLSLREIGEGFRLVSKADESLKVIIEPNRA